ncbi:MAG TPA: mannitol dehydrogenase family protein [Actinomycetales bacterium]
MLRLDDAALDTLPLAVDPPRYDRSATSVGIVHVGVGGFHRAHAAMYVDRLLRGSGNEQWAIGGVGVFAGERATREAFKAQDGLYTLMLHETGQPTTATVIGSLREYLLAPDDPTAVLERMSHPQTRVVSMTITEGGYAYDVVTGALDVTVPGIAHDLAHPDGPPTSVFGLVTRALALRRERGLPAFTVMSCDNVQGNGHVARGAFTAFAREGSPDLAAWMDDNVSFPSSMVDRITPRPTSADGEEVARTHGYRDDWALSAEPFTQWVLEDDFGNGRPPLEDVGVSVVADVAPYEMMKLRLLNAAHQVLSHVGSLVGLTYVHEACLDPMIGRLVEGYLHEEGMPTVPPVPGEDLPEYCRQVVRRFSNSAVEDTLHRVSSFGSDRIFTFLLPVVRDQLAAGRDIRRAVFTVAAWARYCEGVDEQGRAIDYVDLRKDELLEAARASVDRPLAFLELPALFGDLAQDERFRSQFESALTSIRTVGSRRTLEQLLG